VRIEIPFQVDHADTFAISLMDLEISHGGLLLLESMKVHSLCPVLLHNTSVRFCGCTIEVSS
jgi:hypothetical protein